jgi:hypothetical protein
MRMRWVRHVEEIEGVEKYVEEMGQKISKEKPLDRHRSRWKV